MPRSLCSWTPIAVLVVIGLSSCNPTPKSFAPTPVTSTAINSVGYDANSHILEIEFTSHEVYQYLNVPQAVANGLISAPSKGQYFNSYIKTGGYQFRHLKREQQTSVNILPAVPPPVNIEPTVPPLPVKMVEPVSNSLSVEPPRLPQEATSISTGMKFVLIPPGTFQMGSPETELGPNSYDRPQHTVEISRSFYMGVYEVTQDEYQQVMGINPSYFKIVPGQDASGIPWFRRVPGQDTSRFPVDSVSWFDAVVFCNSLSVKDGQAPYYTLTNVQREGDSITSASVSPTSSGHQSPESSGYRLPTEAEWEYACRAGTTTPFHFGSTSNGREANVDGSSPYGSPKFRKVSKGPWLRCTTTVGLYAKNAFGLFDMHGNVCEWCEDVYDWTAYGKRSGTTTDPLVTSDSTDRVQRGGTYSDGGPWVARSAHRLSSPPFACSGSCGFRVVISATVRRTP